MPTLHITNRSYGNFATLCFVSPTTQPLAPHMKRMNKKPKVFVIFITILLVYWTGIYVWLDPDWAQSRLEKIISIGASKR